MSRRRRHKRYGSAVEVSLGSLPFMNDSVNVMDVVIGIGAALLGSAVAKGIFKKVAPEMYMKVATTVGAAMPMVTGGIVSAALYYGQGKSSRAKGHAVGAAAAGLALGGWDLLKAQLGSVSPYLDFSEVVSVNMGNWGGGLGNYNGVLINDNSDRMNGYSGVLIADKSDGLNELAAMSMAPDDDGLAALAHFR